MNLSIKLRVTLLCTLLTAAVAALALNILLAGEQRIRMDYYQSTLLSTAELARDDVRYENGRLEIDRNLDDLPGVRVSLFNEDGDLVYGRRWLDRPFSEGELRREQDTRGTDWFVYDTLLTFTDGGSLWLRCLCSAGAAEGVHSGGLRLTAWLLPGLILLAGLGGYGIARQAFRPVSQIVRTAEGIADGADLKKRIALTGARDELYDLAGVFDAMLERLDLAFERERRFTADVSHELRTPVTSILTQSEYALSGDADDEDRRTALAEIHARAAGMADLTRRLLLLARMDAGQLPASPEPVDLDLLAETAAESIAESASERGMTVLTDARSGALIRADQTMVIQAMLNLLENAVRYGREGGFIHLCVSVDGGEARLCVSDDGPGIPEKDLPHLFERFYQADAARHGQGSGLGLSLVERIMQLHGGRAEAASTPGKGSCFTLIFPAAGGET